AGLVDTAFVVIVPEMSGSARVNRVALLRIDENSGDALGILQSHVGPVLAVVSGLVDAVANRATVACPRFAAAHTDNSVVRRIDRHGTDRLNILLVEDGFEANARIDRLPHSAAGRADEDGNLSVLIHCINGGDATTH